MTKISSASDRNAAAENAALKAKAIQAAIGVLRKSFDPQSNLAQDLFKKLDANGDGVLTRDELEAAVMASGSTKAAADALFSKLDPKNAGTVTGQQFSDRIKSSKDSKDSSAVTAITKTLTPSTSLLQNLFSQIDTSGDGTISKSEFEAAVTKSGGSQTDADDLFSQLDPTSTGTITLQQLAAHLTSSQKGTFISSLIV